MTSKEVNKINTRHIPEVDRQYRMHGGLSSELMDFENGTIILRVTVSEKWTKSPEETAIQLAGSWKNNNPELSSASSYRAFILEKHKGFVQSQDIIGEF